MSNLIRNRESGTVTATTELKVQNPNTSFPSEITEDIVDAFGYDFVYQGQKPELTTKYQTIVQDGYEQIDDRWYSKFVIGPIFVEYTDENDQVVTVEQQQTAHEAAIDAEAANSIRQQRNKKLADSDWTQLSDAPVDSTAWATYRQQLRDITASDTFPEGSWPVEPGGDFEGPFVP